MKLSPALQQICGTFLFVSLACAGRGQAIDLEVIVAPRATVIEREGITGGGHPLATSKPTFLIYPNHEDDFGGSFGTGSSQSTDGGRTWTQLSDNWPIPETVDLWIDQLNNGDLLALGIHWTPDPKKRREVSPEDVPDNAYSLALSQDKGKSWTKTSASIACPPEVGVIARPLPHIFEEDTGTLLMPAYAWSSRGNSSLLMQSTDHGQTWAMRSLITTSAGMVKAGAAVTTPWLETSVCPTRDGALLAVVRTGSNVKSLLVALRSTDNGHSWSTPEVLPFAGKSPTLTLLPNGVLTLVTALSKNHCRVYLSADGTGRTWSQAHVISSLTGGNVGVTPAGSDTLLITSPANRRIDAWSVQIKPKAKKTSALTAPANITMSKGMLRWNASPDAVAYRITPILIKPGPIYTQTKILPYATIQTRDDSPQIELGRQLLIGSSYVFEVAAVDSEGRVSSATRSEPIQL